MATEVKEFESAQPPVESPRTEIALTWERMSFDDMIALAEQRVKMIDRLITTALRRTNERHWADFGGNPYLTAAGAEKILSVIPIRLSFTKRADGKAAIDKLITEDENGAFYLYIVSGRAELPGGLGWVEVIGTCSQRDQFFAKARGEMLPASKIDEGNIVKAAATNMEVNAITRLLGLRDLTWDDLRECGINRDAVAKVKFQKGGKTNRQDEQSSGYNVKRPQGTSSGGELSFAGGR